MKYDCTLRLSLRTIALCVLLAAAARGASAQSAEDRRNSSLVFKGTVVRTQATTINGLPASPNTAVVRVDKVEQTTGASNDYAGREITVYVKEPSSLKAGDEAVFFTQGWLLLEDGVAVRELGHAPPPPPGKLGLQPSVLLMSDKQAALLQTEEDSLLRERVAEAALVVEGRVVNSERVEVLAAEGRPRPAVLSEHAPVFKRAVVEVSSVLGGTDGSRPKTVTVIYLSGADEDDKDALSLKVGDSGLFVLSKAQVDPPLRFYLRDVDGRIEGLEKSYVMTGLTDFRPKGDAGRVKTLLKHSGSK